MSSNLETHYSRHFAIIQSLHSNMEISVTIGGFLSEPIKLRNCVNRIDHLAPILFPIFFSLVLLHRFNGCDQGIYICVCVW